MSKFHFDIKAKNAKKNLRIMLDQIGAVAVDHTKNVVFPSQSWEGKAWRPLKDPTIDRPALQKTGKLRRSIRYRTIVSQGRVIVYDPTKYGGYHDKGTKTLPRRQFMGIDRRLHSRIGSLISRKMPTLVK